MKLSSNQQLVLLLFIVAIVSVIFMEYTREYLDAPQSSPQNKSTLEHVNDAIQSATHAVNSLLKK